MDFIHFLSSHMVNPRIGGKRLPQTAVELGQNILICEKSEMIDRLAHSAEIGIDEVLETSIVGQDQQATLDLMSAFGTKVLPHLKYAKRKE